MVSSLVSISENSSVVTDLVIVVEALARAAMARFGHWAWVQGYGLGYSSSNG